MHERVLILMIWQRPQFLFNLDLKTYHKHSTNVVAYNVGTGQDITTRIIRNYERRCWI